MTEDLTAETSSVSKPKPTRDHTNKFLSRKSQCGVVGLLYNIRKPYKKNWCELRPSQSTEL